MEAASVKAGTRRTGLNALLSAEGPGPLLALLGGALLIALGAGLVAAHVTIFALDESLIQQSALHYSSDLPHSLLHDLDARATDRLYSLVLSIAYRLSGGPAAIRIDHLLSVAMFVSAVAPIYLMARIILRSSWSSVAVALLSVAVPWLTLTSALFTENLSYPIFWWVMLAVCAAIWRPTPRNDLLALVSLALLVCTRVQFAALGVGYLLCAIAFSVWRAWPAGAFTQRLRRTVTITGRGFPFTAAAVLALLVAFVYARASARWPEHVQLLFGTYRNVIIRHGLPPNMTEGLLVELIALALGVGLLPVMAAVPWYLRRLARPALERRWVYLAACGALLSVFLILTVYAQGGYLGGLTEERYFFYVVPVFWVGAFAAVREGGVRVGDIVLCALALTVLFGAIPFLPALTEETAFLAPVESIVPSVLAGHAGALGIKGLTVQDALVLLTVLAGLVAVLIWWRRTERRAYWIIGVGLVIQLSIAGYAFAVIDGKVSGIQGRTVGNSAPLGWVDSHAAGHTVTWLESLSTAQPPAIDAPAAALAADQTHVTLFWNSQIRNTALVPRADVTPLESPASALPALGGFSVQPSSGELDPATAASHIDELVGQTQSPFVQLAGSQLARSPDGFLTLTRVARPVRAVWMTSGLQQNSYVAPGAPVQLSAYATSREPTLLTMHLVFDATPAPSGASTAPAASVAAVVEVGGVRRSLLLQAGAAAQVLAVSGCTRPGQPALSGTLEARPAVLPSGASAALVMPSVWVTEASSASACASRR